MNKGEVYTIAVFAILVSVISVSAEIYIPQPDSFFRYRNATCDENGTISIDVIHNGINTYFRDINFTIESSELSPIKMTGSWWQFEWFVQNYTNYTGPDFTSSSMYTFKSTTGIYTKGTYKIRMDWPSNSIYATNIQFAVNCSGISCKTDDDCIGQQECKGNFCAWLNCSEDRYPIGHTCMKRCEDNNKCTTDYYIDNQCLFQKIDKCCITDKDCENNEQCDNSLCVKKTQYKDISTVKKIWTWLKAKF